MNQPPSRWLFYVPIKVVSEKNILSLKSDVTWEGLLLIPQGRSRHVIQMASLAEKFSFLVFFAVCMFCSTLSGKTKPHHVTQAHLELTNLLHKPLAE